MNNNAVITKLQGGLGNQMFQYAVGRNLALKLNCPLILDLTWFNGQVERTYKLDSFSINCEKITNNNSNPSKVGEKFEKLKNKFRQKKMGRRFFLEKKFSFDPNYLKLTEPSYFEGYWQTEKYFKQFEEQIRKDFQLREVLTEGRQKTAELIKTKNSISVHIRRGDYVTNKSTNQHHGTCSANWYENMMERMTEYVTDPVFFVFSDDPDWSKSNLPSHWPTMFVEPNQDGCDEQDMALMSLCKNHIIANSSFSWWGAWLCKTENKVIAPAHWFANESLDTSDIIPAQWEKL